MKTDIHPKYYPEATVRCACGNTWVTGATQEAIRTDICSKCHPFFTGEMRIVDTAGQVERFTRRAEKGRVIADDLAVKAAVRKPVRKIEVILDEEEVASETIEVALVEEAEPRAKTRKAREPKAQKEADVDVVEAVEAEASEPKETEAPAKKRKASKPQAQKEAEVVEAVEVDASEPKETKAPAKKRKASKPKTQKKEESTEAAATEPVGDE